MNTVSLSLCIEHWSKGTVLQLDADSVDVSDHYCHSFWIQSGKIAREGSVCSAGTGWFQEQSSDVLTAEEDTCLLHFLFSSNNIEQSRSQISTVLNGCGGSQGTVESHVLFNQSFATPLTTAVLRLDQVDFPAGAVAYLHTHPGAGVRYLVAGSLNVISETSSHQQLPGDTWFEGANTPVRAIADKKVPSRFIRMMLLPSEYKDQSTFTLVNPDEDGKKPRLQTNTRHFDKPVKILHS